MFKRPTLIILSLVVTMLVFSATAFVWQTYQNSGKHAVMTSSKVDLSWQQGSKTVDLDDYIAKNQVSANISEKKQRVMLEPELIHFYGTLQAVINSSKADLVIDALAVWGISPLPEVAFSTYIRSPDGKVIAVYPKNVIIEPLT